MRACGGGDLWGRCLRKAGVRRSAQRLSGGGGVGAVGPAQREIKFRLKNNYGSFIGRYFIPRSFLICSYASCTLMNFSCAAFWCSGPKSETLSGWYLLAMRR